MESLKVTGKFASAPDIRKESRRVVETDDGAFLIKRLEGMDFIEGGVSLPSGKKIEADKKTEGQIKKELTQDMIENAAAYYSTIVDKGVVSEDVVVHPDGSITFDLSSVPVQCKVVRTPKLVIEGVPDTTKNEILITDLCQATRVKIISEIEKFCGLSAVLEKQLETFRSKTEAEDSSDVESLREDADRDSEAAV